MSRVAAGVLRDPAGHLVIAGEDGPALVTLVDTGPHLTMWSHQGADIRPKVARQLAAALTAWADREDPDMQGEAQGF